MSHTTLLIGKERKIIHPQLINETKFLTDHLYGNHMQNITSNIGVVPF